MKGRLLFFGIAACLVLVAPHVAAKKHQAAVPKSPTVHRRHHPEIRMPEKGTEGNKPLTSKQSEMRDAFIDCIKQSTDADPVDRVKDLVFSEQEAREDSLVRSMWEAIRGSPTHQGHEVCLARAYGLKGFKDTREIKEGQGSSLVPLASTAHLDVVETEIPPDRRYAREWVKAYLTELSETMYRHAVDEHKEAEFESLRVTSTIRSVDDQQRIVRRGLSPADCRYDYLCSTHTTGSSVDIGLRGTGSEELSWLRERLMKDQRERKIYFIRENSHFHVFVLPPKFIGEE